VSSTAAPRPALHQQTFLEKDTLPGSDRRCDSHKESAESSSCETLQRESAYHCFRGSWSCHIVQVQECWPNIAQDGLSECGKLQHSTSMAASESHIGHECDPHDQSTKWHPSCTHCLWSERVIPAHKQIKMDVITCINSKHILRSWPEGSVQCGGVPPD